jgi:long-chain fatty acid transport protein
MPSPSSSHKAAAALACALLFTGSPAIAAGYGLKEYSADAMAAAYAGAAATGSDASYLAYNPASLAGVSSTDFAVDTVIILPGSRGAYTSATTSAGNPTGGRLGPAGFISGAIVPAFALRHRLTDRLAIGISVDAPFGLKTDYPMGWAGRYYGLKSELLTINAKPTVSYQVTPEVSIGAGLQVEFAQATLTSAIDTGTLGALNGIPGSVPGGQDSFARLSGKNWAFGYTAGILATPADGLSIGLAYHSSIRHDFKGPLTFNLDSAGIGATIRSLTGLFANTRQSSPLTTPDIAEFGIRKDFSEHWTVMLEADWIGWSRFHELRVMAANPLQPDDVTTARWHNTMFGSLGAEYRASEDWTFRFGTAYDQSPVPDATREARIPDADRIWLSAGVRWKMNDDFYLNVTASRLFFLKTDVMLNPAIPGAALRGTLSGTTESYANVAGFQLTYRPG